MEEKKPLKIKFKTAIVLIIIGAIILTIFGANVYASANGYGNIFFLIKYLVTGEKLEISGKDELLSDRDITISYEPIVLTEKIKIQIRNLQIKDNKAKLFVAVNDNQSTEDTPLMYKVYNNENKLICDQKSSKEANNETEYIDELLLKEFKNDEKIIHLEIFNSKNQKLTRITINLETREVIVDGEKEAIEKISEIELKKYLSIIAGFEENFDVNDEDSRISLAIRINSILNRDIVDNGLFDATEVNNILKNLGYGEILTNNYNGEFFKEKVVNGKKYFEMIYEPDTVNMETIVGEIKDITYSSNIYTATFKYLNYSPKTNINYFDYKDDAKEATIYFKLNEDTTYSTFKILKFEYNNVLIENNELIGSNIVTQLTPSGFGTNAKSIEYIEMTEAKYKEYSTSPYSFRIQEMVQNDNRTITIKGRVYKEIELLSITKEQYNDLINGKTIDLLGYQMKVNKDEDSDNGGYDLLITSTGNKWMKFYVEKNSDGSGKLHWYTEREMYEGTSFQEGETGRFVGTDIYMQITLDENLKCKWGNESTTLQQEYLNRKSNGTLNIKEKDDTVLPFANDEFIFQEGNCTSIIFSNI